MYQNWRPVSEYRYANQHQFEANLFINSALHSTWNTNHLHILVVCSMWPFSKKPSSISKFEELMFPIFRDWSQDSSFKKRQGFHVRADVRSQQKVKVVLGPYKDGAIAVEVSGAQVRQLKISRVCIFFIVSAALLSYLDSVRFQVFSCDPRVSSDSHNPDLTRGLLMWCMWKLFWEHEKSPLCILDFTTLTVCGHFRCCRLQLRMLKRWGIVPYCTDCLPNVYFASSSFVVSDVIKIEQLWGAMKFVSMPNVSSLQSVVQ